MRTFDDVFALLEVGAFPEYLYAYHSQNPTETLMLAFTYGHGYLSRYAKDRTLSIKHQEGLEACRERFEVASRKCDDEVSRNYLNLYLEAISLMDLTLGHAEE
jgi:hypothetical protein